MARMWKEPFDPDRHHDHRERGVGPHGAGPATGWAYFVEVCGFTFEFMSLDHIRAALEYYSRKIHPSSRLPEYTNTNLCHERGEWQPWWGRVPLYLQEEPKRVKVVKALEKALETFDE
jgi:hypothetical protein